MTMSCISATGILYALYNSLYPEPLYIQQIYSSFTSITTHSVPLPQCVNIFENTVCEINIIMEYRLRSQPLTESSLPSQMDVTWAMELSYLTLPYALIVLFVKQGRSKEGCPTQKVPDFRNTESQEVILTAIVQ